MSDDIERFAQALREHLKSVSRQTRGIMAKHLDRAATSVQQQFLASQGPYGRGMAGSAGTIRARMSGGGSEEPVGYLMGDGKGVWFWEHGGRHNPPSGAFRQAARQVMSGIGPEVRRAMVDVKW